MDDHFHLIVETPKGNLSEFMRHFNISYTGAGKALGNLDYTAVSRERKRLRERVQTNRALKKAFGEIESSFLS